MSVLCRGLSTAGVTHLPQRAVEEVACSLVPRLGIGQHNITHFVVALKHADGTLKKGLGEGGINNVRRVVAQHVSKVIAKDFLIHLLKADHVGLGELRAVSFVEGLHDLG